MVKRYPKMSLFDNNEFIDNNVEGRRLKGKTRHQPSTFYLLPSTFYTLNLPTISFNCPARFVSSEALIFTWRLLSDISFVD